MNPKRSILVGLLALLLGGLAVAGTANATSANTDVTDIWWNRAKSGTGYQMVNTGTFLFVTGYLYGADLQPFWFSAELQVPEGASAVFSGPVYVSSGPHFGGPFGPPAVTYREAGAMTFVLTSSDTGRLSYTIDGVEVDELLERQPLTLDTYAGSYRGVYTSTASNCGEQNGTSTVIVDFFVVQDGQAMSQLWQFPDGSSCTYDGIYTQLGRMGQFDAIYNCSSGDSGPHLMFEMKNVPYMFTARIFAPGSASGCRREGEIAAVIPR